MWCQVASGASKETCACVGPQRYVDPRVGKAICLWVLEARSLQQEGQWGHTVGVEHK